MLVNTGFTCQEDIPKLSSDDNLMFIHKENLKKLIFLFEQVKGHVDLIMITEMMLLKFFTWY